MTVREIYENCIEKDNYILYNIIKVSFLKISGIRRGGRI